MFAGYGLDVLMGVTLLPPSKSFSIGSDSQGIVINPMWDGRGGVWTGGAVSGLGVLSWKGRRVTQGSSFFRAPGLDSSQWTHITPWSGCDPENKP